MNNKKWSQQYKQSVRRIREFIMFDRGYPIQELPIVEEELIERSSLLQGLEQRKKFFEEPQMEIGIDPEYIEQARDELVRERKKREASLIAFAREVKAIYIRIIAIFVVIGVISIPIIFFLLYIIFRICQRLEEIYIPLGTNLFKTIFIEDKTIYFASFASLILGHFLFRIIVYELERMKTDIPK